MTLERLTIDRDRVISELKRLAGFSDAPPPAVTRILFSEQDREAREFLKAACRDAELSIHTDAVGNVFARWEGADSDLPAVATGSHCDAIPHSGQYDGTVGVWGGLEAIRCSAGRWFQTESLHRVDHVYG